MDVLAVVCDRSESLTRRRRRRDRNQVGLGGGTTISDPA
jgi:hypothetical protein